MSALRADPSNPGRERIAFADTEVCLEARRAAANVLASGWLTTGPEVAAFEEEFAAFVGARRAVAVSSCSAAIELSLLALHLPPGSKVLTSAMTFCGAVNAIMHAGLQPVLVDVNPLTMMPDPATTAEAVARSGGVAAMVVLHFAGHPAPVVELAEAAGLGLERVVEDAAHALGTSVGDRPVGSISAATCFSFYATKNLPIGEGGMVSTDDPAVAEEILKSRLHGMSRDAWKRYTPGHQSWRYDVEVAGLKANMTDLQAAIGRAQMLKFAGWQGRRASLAERYQRQLSTIPGVIVPRAPADGTHAWHLFVIQLEPTFGMDRDAVANGLSEAGIDCSVHFIPIHHQTYYRRTLDLSAAQLPAVEELFRRILSLPLYPGLGEASVDRVCQAIAEIQLRGTRGSFAAMGAGR
jgi:dTDP-4-amino-4,6-dideoxygalactose transaminase